MNNFPGAGKVGVHGYGRPSEGRISNATLSPSRRDVINLMTTNACEPCALRDRGESDRAEGIETNRALRLLRAVVSANAEEQASIGMQLRDCGDCRDRIIPLYLGMLAGQLLAQTGNDASAAVAWVDQRLAENPAPA